ncbi:hypothetical protein HNR44_002253 [Geomicrobium halophilum]|uniref:Uncharacterized protein n=1 Tax=Geomicrobium halophilum TaxID=549000 RepID=A0A841PNC7_9BACL|nr:hypothetical protein [Geomicrobium halophilum]MBB6450270.1 hypothetical protein [Geomicrobium halophilum]
MGHEDIEKQVIDQYQQDENMMILVFAQWCVNQDLDPHELYKRAYPDQAMNAELEKTLELTVPKEEAGEVEDQTLLGVLSLFGNNELAMIVTQEIEKRKE